MFKNGFINTYLLIGVIIFSGLLIIVAIFFYAKSHPRKVAPKIHQDINTPASVSGIIDYNGITPKGATISIGEKLLGDKDYSIIIQNLPVKDLEKWTWNNAKVGQQYQFQAYLMVNGQEVVSSETESVTAPASYLVLILNVPNESSSETSSANLSGSLDINGYIPPGAIIDILGRKLGDVVYGDMGSNIPAADGVKWSFNNALSGTTYEVMAQLKLNGTTLASSKIDTVAAPAQNEVLRIDSTSVPPQITQNSVISGIINLNGYVPSQSSIVILERPVGSSDYLVAQSGITPVDQASWSFNQALPGTMYQIQASLKVNGNDYALSNSITVPAPAANKVLIINSQGQLLPAPTQMPSIVCSSKNASGLWNVIITYNNVAQANQYWLRMGNDNADNDLLDNRYPASNNLGQGTQSLSTGYIIREGTAYYTKYSYSPDSTSANLGDYSAWSAVNQFTCVGVQSTNNSIPSAP